MKRSELYQTLSERIPGSLSAEWDNDGLMCFPSDREAEKVLCTLDITDETVSYAVRNGFDLIVSHHPLVFRKLSSLTPFDPTANRLLTLVREDIAVFSFHTRFDGVKGGVNDVLAALLGLSRVSPLGTGEAAMARVGDLPSPLSFSAFVQKVKATLDVPFVVGKDTGRPITKVALCGGEGKDFIPDALKAGADVYLSGRLGYHAMQDAPLSLLEAGHYYTERPSVNALASLVNEICGAETETLCLNPLQIY